MERISFENIKIQGELAFRCGMNYSRLESSWYKPEMVYVADKNGWPGDWEGRTILALTLLAQSTGREPAYLDKIIELLPKYLNEKGYLGRVQPDGVLDEQQLSGHSWLLRGLVEYYLWKKDDKVLEIIEKMVNNLLLPARGLYRQYPLKKEERIFEGTPDGYLADALVGNWYTSTDIGCAFLLIDGASHVYQVLKKPELKELLDEMVETFLGTDILGISFQTHATLSSLRGILKLYEITKKEELLQAVEKTFSLYKKEGMTENYANYNWFGRPTWTEPCAVIDSLLIAMSLWEKTKKSDYIEDAHRIFYNGIGHGQRPNGGFGCDNCAGVEDEFLYSKIYEAYWCCTMRGGDGLSNAVAYNCFQDGNTIFLPFYNDCTMNLRFDDGDVIIKERTLYPYEGYMEIQVVSSNVLSSKVFSFYIPSWVNKEDVKVRIEGQRTKFTIIDDFIEIECTLLQGNKIDLYFNIPLKIEGMLNHNSMLNYHTYWHGFLLLGHDNILDKPINISVNLEYEGGGKYRLHGTDAVLSPVNDVINMGDEEFVTKNKKQILFKGK